MTFSVFLRITCHMTGQPTDFNPASDRPEKTASQGDTTRRRRFRFPHSWKEVKSMGWKMILAFILFYLIRDTLLYIVIPYLLAKGIISL